MVRQILAWAALGIGVILLGWSFVPGYGPQETWFAGTIAQLDDPNKAVTAVYAHPRLSPNIPGKELQFERSGNTISVDLSGLDPDFRFMDPIKWYTLELVKGQRSEYLDLQVLPKKYGGMATIGAVLTLLAGPEVLIRKTRLVWQSGNRQVPVSGWLYLLLEPGTGLSLARTQLILLFVPAAVVYLTLSFPLHQFPPMPETVWAMLGLGGASAALSTIMTPRPNPNAAPQQAASPKPADATAAALMDGAPPDIWPRRSPPAPSQPAVTLSAVPPASQQTAVAPMAPTETVVVRKPSTTDLFEESTGFGDISRYQSLVICLATSVTFFVSFFDTWAVPSIPSQVLQLLGTSLAVYVGVKGVNQAKDAMARKAPPAP